MKNSFSNKISSIFHKLLGGNNTRDKLEGGLDQSPLDNMKSSDTPLPEDNSTEIARLEGYIEQSRTKIERLNQIGVEIDEFRKKTAEKVGKIIASFDRVNRDLNEIEAKIKEAAADHNYDSEYFDRLSDRIVVLNIEQGELQIELESTKREDYSRAKEFSSQIAQIQGLEF